MAAFAANEQSTLGLAVLGALVADAATLPVHWMYNNADLRATLGDKVDAPEFFTSPVYKFYGPATHPGMYELGQSSTYGEQLILLLKALKVTGGSNPNSLAGAFATQLVDGAGYKDHAQKDFLAKVAAGNQYPDTGADDNQGHIFYKTLAAMCSDASGGCLENVIRCHQNNNLAFCASMTYFTLFSGLLNGRSAPDAAGEAMEKLNSLKAEYPEAEELAVAIQFALDHLEVGTYDMLAQFDVSRGLQESVEVAKAAPFFRALTCANPQVSARVFHVVLTATSYVDGVRSNLLVGGDNASAAIGVAACLVARFGSEGVPQEWINQYANAEAAIALIKSVENA